MLNVQTEPKINAADFQKNALPRQDESFKIEVKGKKSFGEMVNDSKTSLKSQEKTSENRVENSQKPEEKKFEKTENKTEKFEENKIDEKSVKNEKSEKNEKIEKKSDSGKKDFSENEKNLKNPKFEIDEKNLKNENKIEKKDLKNQKNQKIQKNDENSKEIKNSDKKNLFSKQKIEKSQNDEKIDFENLQNSGINSGNIQNLENAQNLSGEEMSFFDENEISSKNVKEFSLDKDQKITVKDFRTEENVENAETEQNQKKDFVTSVKFENNSCEMQLDLSQNAKENILSLNNQTAASQGSTFQAMLSNQIQQNAGDLVKAGQIVLKDNNVGSIKLIMHPESLGNVKIDLQISDKVITGKIIVSSQEALNAFKESADILKNAFNQNGFETSGFDLSFQGQDSSGNQNFKNQQEQQKLFQGSLAYSDLASSSDFNFDEEKKYDFSYKSSVNIVA